MPILCIFKLSLVKLPWLTPALLLVIDIILGEIPSLFSPHICTGKINHNNSEAVSYLGKKS